MCGSAKRWGYGHSSWDTCLPVCKSYVKTELQGILWWNHFPLFKECVAQKLSEILEWSLETQESLLPSTLFLLLQGTWRACQGCHRCHPGAAEGWAHPEDFKRNSWRGWFYPSQNVCVKKKSGFPKALENSCFSHDRGRCIIFLLETEVLIASADGIPATNSRSNGCGVYDTNFNPEVSWSPASGYCIVIVLKTLFFPHWKG